MEPISRNYLLRELKEKGVRIKTDVAVQRVEAQKVVIGSNGNEEALEADLFITAFGGRSEASLYLQIKKYFETYRIGDSAQPGKIIDAVRSGFALAKII